MSFKIPRPIFSSYLRIRSKQPQSPSSASSPTPLLLVTEEEEEEEENKNSRPSAGSTMVVVSSLRPSLQEQEERDSSLSPRPVLLSSKRKRFRIREKKEGSVHRFDSIAAIDEVLPGTLYASSTRWAILCRMFGQTNPFSIQNVLNPDPALVWDSGRCTDATIEFVFDSMPAPVIVGVAIQHAVFRTTFLQRDQLVWQSFQASYSALNPEMLDYAEGIVFDRGWTILSWKERVHIRRLQLHIRVRGMAHMAIRRVRFMLQLKPKSWFEMHTRPPL